MAHTSTVPGVLLQARFVPVLELQLKAWTHGNIVDDPERKTVTLHLTIRIGNAKLYVDTDIFRSRLAELVPSSERVFQVRQTDQGLLFEKVDLFGDGTWTSVYPI